MFATEVGAFILAKNKNKCSQEAVIDNSRIGTKPQTHNSKQNERACGGGMRNTIKKEGLNKSSIMALATRAAGTAHPRR